MRGAVLALPVLLTACGPRPPPERADATATSRALDGAAIASGQMADPAVRTAAGAYEADTDTGFDRMCVTGAETALAVGLLVSAGAGGACLGRGTAERSGTRLRLLLGEGCRIDATFEGRGIALPDALPEGCRALCTLGATLAGATIPKVGDAPAAAHSLTDAQGHPLCPLD